jgi:hypothetical protein
MLAPRPVTRNTGSRLWISSEEMSISRLTKPSAQMAPGSRRRGVGAPVMRGQGQATATEAPSPLGAMAPIS